VACGHRRPLAFRRLTAILVPLSEDAIALGALVGWDMARFVVRWPVSWDVVVAVDMRWFLFWFV